MFKAVFKSTAKTTLRSPVTILSLAALLFYFITSLSSMEYGQEAIETNYHKVIYNSVGAPLITVISVFICVIACVDIMRDKRNKFYDVTKATGISILKYFTAKLCVYLLTIYAVTLVISYGNIFYSGIHYGYLWYILSHGVIWDIFIRVMLLTVPIAFIYISGSLFLTLYTQNPAVGIVSGIIYTLIRWIFIAWVHTSFFGDYIYGIPQKVINYIYFLDVPELVVDSMYSVSLGSVLLSYGIIICISFAFLAAGYYQLLKIKD